MRVTLSNNGAFALTDEEGNMTDRYYGFYLLDTRFVRKAVLRVKPEPEFIGASSTFREGISYFSIGDEGILVRKRTLDGSYSEEFLIYNASERPLSVAILYTYEAPIEDIFQGRGFMGLKEEVALPGKGFYSRRVGTEERTLRIESNLTREGENLRARIEISPGEKAGFFVRFIPGISGRASGIVGEKGVSLQNPVSTGSVALDGAFERAVENLKALTLSTVYGPVPLAGLPYFACPFGRDAIITSLFLLPYYPGYAGGTLKLFASIQGRKNDPESEEEPGKIPHEFRLGQLAQSGKVPFGPYYGTVDATPLYVALAGEYLRWTGDEKLIEELRPNITMAVKWILEKLRDGYITYVPGILGNKGWKDSRDAIVDEDGNPAKPPIALVEVQGYAYWALKLAGELELTDLDPKMLLREAEKLKKRFNRDFWVGNYYALALNGDGRALRVVSSNMGHLLLTGVAEHGREVAERLFKPDMLSTHGIRTLSSKEKAYNPFRYHRGSVWPHDNALIALGLARIGRTDLAKELAEGIFETAKLMPWRELPELYSGLNDLVPVPRANSPQAWSASSLFALVTAILGMEAEDELTVRPAEGVNFLVRVTFRGRKYMIRANRGVEVEPP
ncbi:glycogen debranching N-terminal domain-containing protein [Thermococcus sp.]|uniref:glycogen debranching N-terminal domain-containing protein n=1 Tax=Thermococcus sp. TaxID=35749 RepID=UPI002633C233|nr:glycogen debranching N-terminal domain-containing protein [Thermococcus sp.]